MTQLELKRTDLHSSESENNMKYKMAQSRTYKLVEDINKA